MKEELLSYIWRYRLWGTQPLTTTDHQSIEIIDVGTLNRDAGPDYFNAKIRINGTTWAGNVEIHVNSSDWYHHHHDTDAGYNSVILHVVGDADIDVRTQKGDTLPQLVLPIDERYLKLAEQLSKSDQEIACTHYWDNNCKSRLKMSLNTLICERLERKVKEIGSILLSNKNDWEETFYQTLAKSFGMKVNEEPFAQLAHSLPQIYLAKHKNNLQQIEAMLMGQAGLLDNLKITDLYTDQLIAEYKFLKQKFSLKTQDGSKWKFARMRPVNSPYVRLAEFAMLIHQSEHLFSRVVEEHDTKELHKLFSFGTSDYWLTHYYPAVESAKSTKIIGVTLRNSLFINCIAPMVFAYGKHTDNENLKEWIFDLLEKIPAERNRIITAWEELGVMPQSAYDTQALLEQRKEYCDKKNCLRCSVGYQIFKENGGK